MVCVKQSPYPIGSEWRRWDLHVHTPASVLGTAFPGTTWEAYLDELEAQATRQAIAVIGITDYLSIDGYERLLAARNSRDAPRLPSVDLILPNIELRAGPRTQDGKALNIHLLVDPSDPDHVAKIKLSLRNLRVKHGQQNRGQQSYGCVHDELIAFARAQRPELDDIDAAYRFGIEQFKPSYEQIIDWFEREGWLGRTR